MSAPTNRRSGNAGPSRTRRARVTRRGVRIAERVSRAFITLGGLGTIAAVTMIFAFLLWVVVPLFRGADVGSASAFATAGRSAEPIAVGSDEHGVLVWNVFADGTLEVLARESGESLLERALVEGARPTALSISPDGKSSALGFADGSVRLVRIGFRTQLLEGGDIPGTLTQLASGARAVHAGGVAERLPTGEVRLQQPDVSVGEPITVVAGSIARLDRADLSSGYALVTVEADGKASLHRVEERLNLLDRRKAPKITRESAVLPYEPTADGGLPFAATVPGAGDNVYLIWSDGRTLRFDTRDLSTVRLVETLDVVPDPAQRVTAVAWVLGRTTLVIGDSGGLAQAWFRTKPYGTTTADGSVLLAAHALEGPRSPVRSLSAGQRNRVLAVGYEDGSARIFQVTAVRLLGEVRHAQLPVLAIGLSPKEDALLARTAAGLTLWSFQARHPEGSLVSVFGKVWYEGLEKPEHVWQSTGGTDDFEPKLGLVPLVFGTLKATVYSMLFGVPIALLAAIFTSEFLSARLRTSVKSVIEIMASLPSVVLGFLAAIVVAPFVQGVVPTVLTWFLMLPTLLLLGAHVWQLLPNHLAIRLAGAPRLACVVAIFPLSILLSSALAPAVESVLFRGDLGAWLNHEVSGDELAAAGWAPPAGLTREQTSQLALEAGAQASGKLPATGTTPLLTAQQAEQVRDAHLAGADGGWTYLLLPLAVVLVVFGMTRWVNPWIRHASKAWSRAQCALAALVKLSAGVVAAILVAGALGWLITSTGMDPRGSFEHASRGQGAIMGSPVQRNALVVGFLMGFAIIPIIYTLAEDALSSVPHQLRLGSLGAGATAWQTATRIVIPTAMSGLFSAVMIGLGRAVGETMIVLMAAGNTSVLEWNVFNGFRTLSANIATEMPEAVVGGTHYRVLFLAAFALFAMTFVLNTLAEVVRQRFRKRAFQL